MSWPAGAGLPISGPRGGNVEISPDLRLAGRESLRGWNALEGWGGWQERCRVGAACGREVQHEGTAFTDFAGLEGERPAVALRQLTADEEAQPGARLRAQAGIVDPEEAFEDLVLLVAGDADPLVLDDQRGTALRCDG